MERIFSRNRDDVKRVLLISWFFPPLRGIASLRPGKWAKYLPDFGYWPIVITADKSAYDELDLPVEVTRGEIHEVPYFNPLMEARKRVTPSPTSGPTENGTTGKRGFRATVFRLGVRVVGLFESRGCLTVTARMPSFYEFWAMSGVRVAEKVLRRYGGEVRAMVSTSGPPASHLLAWHVKRKHPEIRWVADYRDLWTQNPIFPGLFPFTYLEKVLERRILSRADAVVTVSEGLAHVLRAHCGGKIHVIENGFDEEDTESIPARISASPAFSLVYTGTIYVSRQDPIPLFTALKGFTGRGGVQGSPGILVRFFVTNRQGKEYLQGLVESFGLGGVVQVNPAVPHREAIGIQKGADALLLLEKDSTAPNGQGVLTGKVFEYLAARKPVLGVGFGAEGELGKVLGASGLGFPLGQDASRIRQILERMISAKNSGAMDQLVDPDDAFIALYSRRSQAARLAVLLDSLVGE